MWHGLRVLEHRTTINSQGQSDGMKWENFLFGDAREKPQVEKGKSVQWASGAWDVSAYVTMATATGNAGRVTLSKKHIEVPSKKKTKERLIVSKIASTSAGCT